MGKISFEGQPPFGALIAKSSKAQADIGFVTLTLTLLPDANSEGTADLQVILTPADAKQLGGQLGSVADTATRWGHIRRER
jgi:hypothetical protein